MRVRNLSLPLQAGGRGWESPGRYRSGAALELFPEKQQPNKRGSFSRAGSPHNTFYPLGKTRPGWGEYHQPGWTLAGEGLVAGEGTCWVKPGVAPRV